MAARSWVTSLLKSVLLGLVVAAIVLWVLPWLQQVEPPSTPERESGLASYASAFQQAAPAVVNIYTTQNNQQRLADPRRSSFMRLGSGVIMSTDGYLLTANHVVDDVDEIQVALQDGRVFNAELVGSDLYTDLAVLKIEAEDLPTIPRNDSYQPSAGDVVLAIGNPYNLGQTVTQGIISATGRISPGSGYSEFIQMDAAINEGNSGGALVNTRGELVGISSASYRSDLNDRGSTGIYFAVSYQLASRIMEQLVNEGEVTRGYLGITAEQSYNDAYAKRGLLIEAVDPGGPAARAGIQRGDFIYEMGGRRVNSVNEGLDLVAESRPGRELEIAYIRNGEQHRTVAIIEQLPDL